MNNVAVDLTKPQHSSVLETFKMNGFHIAYLIYGKLCDECINNNNLENVLRKRIKCTECPGLFGEAVSY